MPEEQLRLFRVDVWEAVGPDRATKEIVIGEESIALGLALLSKWLPFLNGRQAPDEDGRVPRGS